MSEKRNDLVRLDNGGMSMVTADPAAIAAAETAKQRIQAGYIMAMNRPRSVDQARINLLDHCKRPSFAEKVEYAKPIGENKKITGPSVRLAECALREWGNILSDSQIVYEDDKIRRVKVFITDLQTNACFNKEIQIGKTVERKYTKDRIVLSERLNSYNEKVYLVVATEDELANKEASAISKAIRNEGLRIIPIDIIDEARAVARETLRNRDAKDPDAAKRGILDAFAQIGIKPIELEKYLKHPIDSVSPAELQDLRVVYSSIRDGEATWADYLEIEKKEAEQGAQAGKAGMEELKEKVKRTRGPNKPKENPPVDTTATPVPPVDPPAPPKDDGRNSFAVTNPAPIPSQEGRVSKDPIQMDKGKKQYCLDNYLLENDDFCNSGLSVIEVQSYLKKTGQLAMTGSIHDVPEMLYRKITTEDMTTFLNKIVVQV